MFNVSSAIKKKKEKKERETLGGYILFRRYIFILYNHTARKTSKFKNET